MTDEELIAIVDQADRTMTPGEWEFFAGSLLPDEEHRGYSDGDDWAEWINNGEAYPNRDADGKGFAALRNNAGAIAQALRRLTQERDAERAERDELLASYRKVVGEHNGLAMTGDAFLAKAIELRTSLELERERREKAERACECLRNYIALATVRWDHVHKCGGVEVIRNSELDSPMRLRDTELLDEMMGLLNEANNIRWQGATSELRALKPAAGVRQSGDESPSAKVH